MVDSDISEPEYRHGQGLAEGDGAQVHEVLAALSDVVYALRLEPDLAFEYVSPSVEDLVGYTPAEHYADPTLGTRLLDPRDADRLAGATRTGLNVPVEFTVRWRSKDGRTVWTEHRCTKRRRADGSIVLYGSARDVTVEHHLKDHLFEAQNKYRLLAENSSDVVFRIDAAGVMRWVSPNVTSLLGWPRMDIVGRPYTEFVHPDDLPGLLADVSRPTDDRARHVTGRLRLRMRDGGYRWVDVNVTEVVDVVGQRMGFVGSGADAQEQAEVTQELARVSDQLRLVLHNSADVLALIGQDGTVRWASPSLRTAFGWEPATVVGTRFRLAAPEYQERMGQQFAAAVAARSSGFSSRLKVRCADGTERWADTHNTLVWNGDGELDYLVVSVRDVTDLVRVEERGRAMLDSMLDPHVLLQAVRDEYGTIVDFIYADANKAACDYMQMTSRELTGARLLDLLPGQAASGMLKISAATVDSGDPLVLDDYPYPHELRQGERRYDIRGVKVGDALSFTWRDVTDRYEAAAALASAEQHYRLLADNATDTVVVVDLDGQVQWVSPAIARVLGYQPDAVTGSWRVLVHPEDLPLQEKVSEQVRAGADAVPWEFRANMASGDFRWMSAVTCPVPSEDGGLRGFITTLRDIHQQVLDRHALALSEQTFRAALAGAPQGMAVVGLHGPFLQANHKLSELVGYDAAWLTSHAEADLVHPDDLEADLKARDRLLAGTADSDVHQERLLVASGAEVWVQHSLALVRDEFGMPIFYVSHYEDVTDARAAHIELDYRAHHDPLTGLINSRQLRNRLASILAHADGSTGTTAVLYCDLDFFKPINDTYGHATGDAVLQQVASRILGVLRDSDEVARLGGDEFVVVLPQVADADAAEQVANRIRTAVSRPIQVEENEFAVTVSVGVATATAGIDLHRLLHNADAAMYRAKNQGRDATGVYL